jgi:hypothetical protein
MVIRLCYADDMAPEAPPNPQASEAVGVACSVLSAEAGGVEDVGESVLGDFGIYSGQRTVTEGGSVALDGTWQAETGIDGSD